MSQKSTPQSEQPLISEELAQEAYKGRIRLLAMQRAHLMALVAALLHFDDLDTTKVRGTICDALAQMLVTVPMRDQIERSVVKDLLEATEKEIAKEEAQKS